MYLRGIRLIARIGSGLFLPVLFFLALSSCTEDQPGILELENTPLKFEDTPFVPENAQETTTSAPLEKKFTGTFIDFWNKGGWTQQQWLDHFDEMAEIGINTVIVQFVAFDNKTNTYTWFNSSNTFASGHIFPDALPRLMYAAEQKNMKVYIGLYFSNEYWDNQTNVSWLQTHADRCNFIAHEIAGQFGSSPAFEGWYIPHEPEPHAYNSAALVGSFNTNFVNRISDYTHTLNDKPVTIAAFFNSALTTTNELLYFMSDLSKGNLQIIMLQDGVGADHVSLDDLLMYYNDAAWGLYGENPDYTGLFWADIETFYNYAPANINRIVRQIQIAFSFPHITKFVSFQYYNDMCPSGPNGSDALKLRNDYIDYLNELSTGLIYVRM